MADRILHHVNVPYPPGAEGEARAFYAGTLGFDEVPKPPEFRQIGMWFQLEGAAQVHLTPGDDHDAGTGHFALAVDDFDAVRHRIESGGWPVEDTHTWEGHRRFYTRDMWGTKIEILEGPPPNA